MIKDLKTKIGLKYKKDISCEIVAIAGGEEQFCKLYESDLIYQFNDKIFNLLIDIAHKTFNVTKEEMMSKSNKRKLVQPRASVIYLMHTYTCITDFALAKKMGKDHSTINHFLNIAKDPMLATFDREFYKLMQECESQFLKSSSLIKLSKQELIIMLRNRINQYEDLIIKMVHDKVSENEVVENLCQLI
jgi:hypothetical protein